MVGGAGPVEHHPPSFGAREIFAVNEALQRGMKSGDFYWPINALEAQLREVCKVPHAVATSSGTAALQLALAVVGVRPGDVVLVPSLSFVAVANAVTHAGAEPVFLDSLTLDLGLSVYKLDRFLAREVSGRDTGAGRIAGRKRIGAVVAVDLLGMPAQVRALRNLAGERGIPLIEDASQALGSVVEGAPCGSAADVAVLSFNFNKIVSGLGGGALLARSEELAARAKHLATTARIPHAWEIAHDGVGWNHRMSPLCAALVGAQLGKLDHFLAVKRGLAESYREAFSGSTAAAFLSEPAGARSNYWLSTILIDPRHANGTTDARDRVLRALHQAGFKARALFTPLHRLAPYRDHARDNPLMADDAWRRAVCLPSGVALAEQRT